MTIKVVADRNCYLISDAHLDAAMAALQEHDDYARDICSAAWGEGTSVIYPNYGKVFAGEVSRSSWMDEVKSFLQEHCEDGSYATFVDMQDDFRYYLFERQAGCVSVTATEPINPFNDECNRLEGLPEAPTYVVFCDGHEYRSFDDFDSAMRFCAEARDAHRRFCLSHGAPWTSSIADRYYVESRRVHRVVAY